MVTEGREIHDEGTRRSWPGPSRLASRRRRLGALITLGVTLLSVPFFAVASLYTLQWYEYAITFQPDRYQPGQPWMLPKEAEEVSFLNRDQQRLGGCFIRAASQPALGTLIFFHGQAGNITNVGWLGEKLADLGFDVLLFDYRGYGKSQGEIADERDLYADADAAYQYVVNERGSASNRVVLYGHSLGTAAAVDLASRRACAAVVLESGFSSASEMASVKLPWMPSWLHRFAVNRFESARKLASVSCPVVVAHGDPDDIVPTREGKALFEAARGPKRLIIVPGAGHGVAGHGGQEYLTEVARFIRASIAG